MMGGTTQGAGVRTASQNNVEFSSEDLRCQGGPGQVKSVGSMLEL